jgi:hypothetical protein
MRIQDERKVFAQHGGRTAAHLHPVTLSRTGQSHVHPGKTLHRDFPPRHGQADRGITQDEFPQSFQHGNGGFPGRASVLPLSAQRNALDQPLPIQAPLDLKIGLTDFHPARHGRAAVQQIEKTEAHPHLVQ